MRVSHETIDLSLFVQSRGALRRELTRHLRTGRRMRYPRAARQQTGRGRLRDVVSIRERPAAADDRAVPACARHWEGDLVFGRRPSAVGTLVERTSRYLLLFPVHGDGKAPRVFDGRLRETGRPEVGAHARRNCRGRKRRAGLPARRFPGSGPHAVSDDGGWPRMNREAARAPPGRLGGSSRTSRGACRVARPPRRSA